MQQISLDSIKKFNQTSAQFKDIFDNDCLPEGYSYGIDTEGDSLPDPDDSNIVTHQQYDPYDDPDSIFFRLPYNDDLPTVSETPPETLCKTLRGDTIDEDGWCTTDIPEGSQLAAGDVIECQSTEDPLPTWSDDESAEVEDDNAPLPDFDHVRF